MCRSRRGCEQAHLAARGRFVDADFVYDGTLLAAAEMLRGGITCCNDMYFFPDAAARAYRASGMRAMLGLPVLDFPTPYAADADGYLHAGLAARDALKHEPRLRLSPGPARAVYRRATRRGQDRDVRPAARPADPDALAGNARRADEEPSRAYASPRSRAAPPGRDRTGLHRHPRRRIVDAGRHRAARAHSAVTSCTARRRT